MRELIQLDEDTRERVERADQRRQKREDLGSCLRDSEKNMHNNSSRRVHEDGAKLAGPKHITKLQREMQSQMVKLVAGDSDVAAISR